MACHTSVASQTRVLSYRMQLDLHPDAGAGSFLSILGNNKVRRGEEDSLTDIFVTYPDWPPSGDAPPRSDARRLWLVDFVRLLKELGVSVWFDDRDISQREGRDYALRRALLSCRSAALIVDREVLRAASYSIVLGAAVGLQRHVVSVITDDIWAEALQGPLRHFPVVRLTGPGFTARAVIDALAEGDDNH
jgi:hypothetical protein